MSISNLRAEYGRGQLSEQTAAHDAIEQFARWFDEARAAGVREINAMSLATASADARPSTRIVLLKDESDGPDQTDGHSVAITGLAAFLEAGEAVGVLGGRQGIVHGSLLWVGAGSEANGRRSPRYCQGVGKRVGW